MATTKEPPSRIRLSVLEPPSPCREPLMDEAVRDRDEIAVDVRGLDDESAIAAIRKAVDRLAQDERLRVQARSAAPALLAAVQMTGERFQTIGRHPGGVELLVWRFYSADERNATSIRRWMVGESQDERRK